MEKKTQDIEDLTIGVLNTIPEPWPDYITLLVFLAIENNDSLLQQYQMLVDKYDQIHGDGKGHVNNTIPKIVKKVGGWNETGESKPARSGLILSYSKLI